MKFLNEFLTDLRNGENIDVYLTLLVCAVIVILDVFGVVESAIVTAAILLTLGLLSFGTLATRKTLAILNDSLQKVSGGKVHVGDVIKPHSLISSDTFASATTILLSGVTLLKTTQEYTHVLVKRLAAGATIRFMIVDPVDSVLDDLVLRSWAVTDRDFHRNRTNQVKTLIDHIAKTANRTGKVEVAYLPFHPSFGMVIIDPNQPHGKCFVELYHHKSSEPNPTFEVKAIVDDPFWCEFFQKQFDDLWKFCESRERVGTL